jgi:hypothetical protein
MGNRKVSMSPDECVEFHSLRLTAVRYETGRTPLESIAIANA